jgi:hypothetical protein
MAEDDRAEAEDVVDVLVAVSVPHAAPRRALGEAREDPAGERVEAERLAMGRDPRITLLAPLQKLLRRVESERLYRFHGGASSCVVRRAGSGCLRSR